MKDSWEWSEADLLVMKSTQTQESLYLEFKESPALAKGDKKEIAKDVSAFANSAGGDILYGVSQTETSPASFKDIDGGVDPNVVTPEWIEQVINSNIQPRIAGIRITPIELKTIHPGYYVYAVHIPASDNAPHQAPDKRYYKRFNFLSTPMEDYEIRDVNNRSRKPELSIDGEIVKTRNESFSDLKMWLNEFIPGKGFQVKIPSFVLRIWLSNSGGTTAKYINVILSFDNLKIVKFDSMGARIDYLRDGKPCIQWDSLDGVILPKSTVKVMDVHLKVKDFKKMCSISTEVSAEGFEIHKHQYQFHNSLLFMAEAYDQNHKKHRLFLSALERWFESSPKIDS